MILTQHEHDSLYALPTLNDIERNEYFSFNEDELNVLYSFQNIDAAIYFSISLAFFKLRYTLIRFSYRDVTKERQHVMRRYFPRRSSPRSLPSDSDNITKIEKKVLDVVGFSRFKAQSKEAILKKLRTQLSLYPRQRQLCRAFLKLLINKNIAIPGPSVVCDIVRKLWNEETSRLTKAYLRYTSKNERQIISNLMIKGDDNYNIVNIRKDMKSFNTQDINNELDKHAELKEVFLIAKIVIPKLKLPSATVKYFSELINYYNGSRLNSLDAKTAQLYLLCYCYTRFLIVNDNLLEAFKKRTLSYVNEAKNYATHESAKFMSDITAVRKQIYDLLILIKNDKNKTNIAKSNIYKCIPHSEIGHAAEIILSENLDKNYLFWKYVDTHISSIRLNLRNIYLSLDITILRDETLRKVVDFMKDGLHAQAPLSEEFISQWISDDAYPYLVQDNIINPDRFEFYFYMKLAHHIGTKKLILEYSVKHRDVEDDWIKLVKWEKDKSKILRKIPYPKIRNDPGLLIEEFQATLPALYQRINYNIEHGHNPDIIVKESGFGELTWRLKSLKKSSDPNESLFANFQKRSIVDVMRFVDMRTNYTQKFESILPRYTKKGVNSSLLNAAILANALRLGSSGMSELCDLNRKSLLTVENNYLRIESLNDALHTVNIELTKLDISKDYNIYGKPHASLDGLKIGARHSNIKARHSPKFLGQDAGVSSYNLIFNYMSLTGRLISSNQYEGNYTFEMMMHQNTSDFNIEYASTDKHGMNSLNFALFDFTDFIFAPRIPKMHNQTLWGLGHRSLYDYMLVKPHKMVNPNYILNQWDNLQRMLVSMVTGEATPSIVIGQMSSQKYRSPTKLALTHYNHLIRSGFILQCIDDSSYRRAIECALNRGEAYNNLYRAITLLNGGKFRGQSETEMMIWDQCTRLVAAIILYYNTYILNYLYQNTKSSEEKEWLLNLSPGAWVHINLLGYYQFCTSEDANFIDMILAKWDWQRDIDNC